MVGSVAIRTPAGLKNVASLSARDASNTLRVIREGWVRTGAGLKQFFADLAVTLSKTAVVARGNSAGTITLTSVAITATPVGGAAPYTYAWTRTAPDAHAWTINNPSSAAASFSTSAAANESWTATFICTVTDAGGQVVASGTVTVTASNIYFGGGGGGGGGPYP